jgi:hypothetical protein|tara:strand:- start:456 stop:836 length:381 start_codon:yes stop_codon:yes gene_type:complete
MKKPNITVGNVESISSLKRLIQNRDLLREELNQDPRKLLLNKIENKISSQLGLRSDTRKLIDGVFDGSIAWSMKDMPRIEEWSSVSAVYKGAKIEIPKHLKVSDLEYRYNYVRPSKGYSKVSWRTV